MDWLVFSAMVLLYNGLLLGAGGVLLARFRRRPAVGRALLMAALYGGGALGLAALCGSRSVFAMLQLAAWCLFLHCPLLLLGLAWMLRRQGAKGAAVLALAALAMIGVGVYALWIEPYWLEVTHYRIQAPSLTRPVKIVVVSDLQTDRIGEYEKDVLRRIQAEKADLVLWTGDYLQTPGWSEAEQLVLEQQLRAAIQEAGLSSPLGLYAVRGDTERDSWPRIFTGTGITTWTQRQSLQLGEICLTGLTRRDSFDRQLQVPRCGAYHIAFGHSPDHALGPIDADLLIAGHTHGGQVQIPFFGPPITFSWVPRAWAAGARTQIDAKRILVVSRGLGMERGTAPRLRFLCRPQLVVLELTPAPQS